MKKLTTIPTLQLVHKTVACLLAFCVINMPVWAIQGGDVINNGGANITIDPGVLTNVNVGGVAQTTIEWGNLDTVTGEQLNFNGSGNFTVLNNVNSTSITSFNGILNGGNGHIIIINPNGMVFGPTAQISAGHFTASTLAIDNLNDFVNGDGSWFNTADAKGVIELQDGSTITATDIELIAHEIRNSGQLISDGGLIVLATGDDIFLGSSVDDIVVMVDMPVQEDPSYSIFNQVDGEIDNPNGAIVLAAGDTFAQALGGLHGQAYTVSEYTVAQSGTMTADTLDIGAANAILTANGSVTAAETINMGAQNTTIGESLAAGSDLTIDMDYSVTAAKNLSSGGNMTVQSHESTILIAGTATSGGTMDMTSGAALTIIGDAQSGDSMTLDAATNLIVKNVTVLNNDLTISADNTFANGNLKAENNILLDTDLYMTGEGDRSITAENGGIIAEGTITKDPTGTKSGNLYVAAEDNIQLNGDVVNNSGGVSVISEAGKIDTEGTGVLNVAISGYSDEEAGVDLPHGEGKAAIVLMSQDTLTLGRDAALIANGSYGTGVDDRAGADLLDADQKFIGGFPRQAGDEVDVAIYAASTGGNVRFNNIRNFQINNQMENDDVTVVLDALNKVLIDIPGDLTEAEFISRMLALMEVPGSGEQFPPAGYNLEAVSRTTQWLNEAVDGGMLPFASAPEVMEFLLGGGEYTLRGAGVASNNYNEAWVLEDQTDAVAAAPLQSLELPELKGCPAEMDAAASELGVNTDQMQLMIASSVASNPNIQPCEACSSLLTAAATLRDVDGARMAALAQIFDTLAPADAPFTPEVSASIATAFADLSADNPQYAMASEYVDAFAQYVAILDSDLKLPVGDTVALVMEKYGSGLTDSDNPNIAAFVSTQLEATGGSL